MQNNSCSGSGFLNKLVISLAMIWLLLCSWQLNSLAKSQHHMQNKINQLATSATQQAIQSAFVAYTFNNNVSASDYWLKIALVKTNSTSCQAALATVINSFGNNELSQQQTYLINAKLNIILNVLVQNKADQGDGFNAEKLVKMLKMSDVGADVGEVFNLKSAIGEISKNISYLNKQQLLTRIQQAFKISKIHSKNNQYLFESIAHQLKSIEKNLLVETIVSFDPLRDCQFNVNSN